MDRPKQILDGKILATVNDSGIGLITFNQPEKRNAMSLEMWHGLTSVLECWKDDSTVRVVVMTGAGDKAFVSGADISQFDKNRSDADAQREYEAVTSRGRSLLAAFPKPIIAQIKGFCLGGGLGIAMQADIRVASDDSLFGIPAAKLGLAYGMDMVRRLISLVGQANSRMMMFTGDRLGASEALRIGLINRVVKSSDLEKEVAEIALNLSRNAPRSIATMKMIVEQLLRDPGDRNALEVDRAVAACFDSQDYKEGRVAFMEKRQPVFVGA